MALRRELTFLSVFTHLPKASLRSNDHDPRDSRTLEFSRAIPALCTSGSCRGSSAFPGTRSVSRCVSDTAAPALPGALLLPPVQPSKENHDFFLAVDVLHGRVRQHRVPSRTEVGTAVPAPALVTAPEVSPCSVNYLETSHP